MSFRALARRVWQGLYTPGSIEFHGVRFHDVRASMLLRQIWLRGDAGFEPELVHFFLQCPFAYSTFFDCGANIGVYAALAERHGRAKTVRAFEPFSRNIRYLEAMKTRNGLSFDVEQVALSNAAGARALYIPRRARSSALAAAASLSSPTHDAWTTETVATESLATYLAPLDEAAYPLLVKLDVEGEEMAVLRSIERHLAGDRIDLVVEILIGDDDRQQTFDLLAGLGYSAWLITNAGLVREDRPLTLPAPDQAIPVRKSCWRNHFFTKRPAAEVARFSRDAFGHLI